MRNKKTKTLKAERYQEPVQKTHFFSTCPPEVVFDALISYLDDNEIEHRINKNFYEVEFDVEDEEKLNEEMNAKIDVSIKVRILQ